MSDPTRAQDTIFIDMKYIILYRKLGFREVAQDVFMRSYGVTEIRIESENQRFCFNGKWHSLLTYKDMVLLECVDRLLKKGYSPNSISLTGDRCLLLLHEDGTVFASFIFEEWGKRYKKLLSEFVYSGRGTVLLYASQLSGGLIDFAAKIYVPDGEYDGGFFERNAPLYPRNFVRNSAVRMDVASDMKVNGTELVKYVGTAEEVIIPSGISKIGTGAFWNNTNVKRIRLPEGLECIAGDAFVYCYNLKDVSIPMNVDTIGDNPFAGCPNVIVKNFSDSFVIEDDVLFDRDKRILIHYAPSKTDNEYIIPESVEWIGKHSFYGCNSIKKVVITKNVEFMGNNVFSDCPNVSLVNFSPYFRYIDGILYSGDLTQLFHYSLGSGVKDVKIAEGTRTIGRNSFWNARNIESITIPKTVRQIGYNPFAYCLNASFAVLSPEYRVHNGAVYSKDFRELVCCTAKAIKSGTISLHDKLESIGRNAFTGCESLEYIKLPETLRTISRGAFSGCIKLTEIKIPKKVELLGDWAFANCTSMMRLSLPNGITPDTNVLKNCPAEVTYY